MKSNALLCYYREVGNPILIDRCRIVRNEVEVSSAANELVYLSLYTRVSLVEQLAVYLIPSWNLETLVKRRKERLPLWMFVNLEGRRRESTREDCISKEPLALSLNTLREGDER